MTALKATEAFRSEYAQAAMKARETLGEQLGPRAAIARALALLASFRRERVAVPR